MCRPRGSRGVSVTCCFERAYFLMASWWAMLRPSPGGRPRTLRGCPLGSLESSSLGSRQSEIPITCSCDRSLRKTFELEAMRQMCRFTSSSTWCRPLPTTTRWRRRQALAQRGLTPPRADKHNRWTRYAWRGDAVLGLTNLPRDRLPSTSPLLVPEWRRRWRWSPLGLPAPVRRRFGAATPVRASFLAADLLCQSSSPCCPSANQKPSTNCQRKCSARQHWCRYWQRIESSLRKQRRRQGTRCTAIRAIPPYGCCPPSSRTPL
mmetsp:Transcript_17385/g.43005  ORF Transcript_17385/g.43005 Transcript_17385/m.43005 type:complete len:263 (+) Transcript_17385:1003-1791(+)